MMKQQWYNPGFIRPLLPLWVSLVRGPPSQNLQDPPLVHDAARIQVLMVNNPINVLHTLPQAFDGTRIIESFQPKLDKGLLYSSLSWSETHDYTVFSTSSPFD